MKFICLVVKAALTGMLIAPAFTCAQSSLPTTYDVSTIKPAPSGKEGMMLNWGNSELKAENVTLEWMMTSAFHARMDQISGEPTWAKVSTSTSQPNLQRVITPPWRR